MDLNQIKLDTNTIKTLVSPTGASDPLVRAIFLTEYHRTLLRFNNLYKQLQLESTNLVDNLTNFSQSFDLVKSFSRKAQKNILGYPSFSVWLDTAWQLVNRKAHLLFPEMHIEYHLESFQKFILAMAKFDKIEGFECCLYTDQKGVTVIPGTGIYLHHPQNIAFQKLHFVTTNDHFQIYTDDGQNLDMLQNDIPRLKNGIELNSVDSDFHLGGRYDLHFEDLSPTSTIKWLSTLEEAWFLIDSCSNFLASEMLIGIQSLVPIYSHAIDINRSQTFREIPGIIALSWMSDTSVIVEALVHEYHHHKLNALLNLDSIIENDTLEAIYYSPWRYDSRPLYGILQGVYVFQAVAEFWHKFLKMDIPLLQKRRVQQRLYAVKQQVEIAVKVLKSSARFSSLGLALIEAIQNNIEQIEIDLSQIKREEVDIKIKAHQQKWETENYHLVKTKVFAVKSPTDLKNGDNNSILNKAFDWLGLKSNIDLSPLTYLRQPFDSILETLVTIYHHQGLQELEDILKETKIGESILLDLICGHTAYISQDYQKAGEFYESCLEQYPNAPYFWQCFMFALRHLNQLEEYELILTNLDTLVSNTLEIKELIRQKSHSKNKVQMMVTIVKTLVG
jgi:HEXXH motif-containing protein